MPTSGNRRRQGRCVAEILALLLAALAILTLVGCASYASLYGYFPPPETTASPGPTSTPTQVSIADPTSTAAHTDTISVPTATVTLSPTSTSTLVLTATDPPAATATAPPRPLCTVCCAGSTPWDCH